MGPQKAGTERWSTLHHHAAGLATMAPRGMINYSEESEILHAVNMLCQDIAKKVRNGESARNRAIKAAVAAHAAQYPGDPSPPALADQPAPLTSAKNQIVLSTPFIRTPKITKAIAGPGGTNPNLLAQLFKRFGGLWASAVSYCFGDSPPQDGDRPNTIMVHWHMISPWLDTKNPVVYLGGFTFTAFR